MILAILFASISIAIDVFVIDYPLCLPLLTIILCIYYGTRRGEEKQASNLRYLPPFVSALAGYIAVFCALVGVALLGIYQPPENFVMGFGFAAAAYIAILTPIAIVYAIVLWILGLKK